MPPDVARWIGIWLPFLKASEAGLWLFWVTEREIIAVPRPSILVERDRLHCATGPAVSWPNGARYWFWRGMQVPEYLIERPHEITIGLFDREPNAELRRVMVERFAGGRERGGGPAAFLRASGARPIDHDERYGTLYSREIPGDEPLVMLEVVNRSPEPDGSFKHYWLRVHPELRPLPPGGWTAEAKRDWLARQSPQPMTAHAAAASLAGTYAKNYRPGIET